MAIRVVVAMSGGVDSSVAALLLVRKRFEVIGLTMCLGIEDPGAKAGRCCSAEGIEDARRVAAHLGIRHYCLNMREALQRLVIEDFCSEYSCGRTPNPCVRCNQLLKFGALWKKATALKARYIATGHYARIAKTKDGLLLRKARDKNKDQSYFLYRLSQSQLARALFPLGGLTKLQVRRLAGRNGLLVAQKPESQEICFLPDPRNYRQFLAGRLKEIVRPGDILDSRGNVLGTHRGIPFYTIGQREGLGIARGYPVYITAIDAAQNTITVGSRQEASSREFFVKDLHLIRPLPKNRFALKVRIRYNHREAPARVTRQDGGALVSFTQEQFAVTPGQSAVFYRGDLVLGGGIIWKVKGR